MAVKHYDVLLLSFALVHSTDADTSFLVHTSTFDFLFLNSLRRLSILMGRKIVIGWVQFVLKIWHECQKLLILGTVSSLYLIIFISIEIALFYWWFLIQIEVQWFILSCFQKALQVSIEIESDLLHLWQILSLILIKGLVSNKVVFPDVDLIFHLFQQFLILSCLQNLTLIQNRFHHDLPELSVSNLYWVRPTSYSPWHQLIDFL